MKQEDRPRILTVFDGNPSADYDWRRSNYPDWDRLFRYVDRFSQDYDIRIHSIKPLNYEWLPESVVVTQAARQYDESSLWYNLTLRLAKFFGLSCVDWNMVCTSFSFLFLRETIAELRQCDIFLSFGGPQRAWLLNPLARLFNITVVYDTFDDHVQAILTPWHRRGNLLRKLVWLVRLFIHYFAVFIPALFSNVVIASHEAHRNLICRRYIVPRKKMHIIHPTVDERINGATDDIREKLGFKEDDIIVVYLGNFSSYSNRHAFRSLRDDIAPFFDEKSKVKFLVIGKVPRNEQNRQSSICYPGYVSDPNRFLAICDIAISPVWSAGGVIEMKVIQYLMMGLPVICTRERGNRFETEAVLYAPIAQFAEVLQDLAQNYEKKVRLSQVAKSYYMQYYSKKRNSEDLIELMNILKKLIDKDKS